MTSRRVKRAQRRGAPLLQDCRPQALDLAPERYEAALRYLFDRPEPQGQQLEWYWNIDEPEFDATALEWTRIQTVLFAHAGTDLAGYSNEQVGMGLIYLMDNSVSSVSLAAIDATVPIEDAMRMMRAMPALWRQCIGPRLTTLHAPIDSAAGRLAYACYMWFDVWPTFWNVRHLAPWQQAVWQVLKEMLDVPCRAVQISALHGIGHLAGYLNCQQEIDQATQAFIRTIDARDDELKQYAYAARNGAVQ